MGTIREKMTADLDLRGFASTTKKEYLIPRCCARSGSPASFSRLTSVGLSGSPRSSAGVSRGDGTSALARTNLLMYCDSAT